MPLDEHQPYVSHAPAPMSDMMNFAQEIFEPLTYAIQSSINLGAYARSTLRLEQVYREMYQSMALRLAADVLTQHRLDKPYAVTVSCPASWWQHFKEAQFRAWALRRWPVRYTRSTHHIRIELIDTYPHADIVAKLGQPVTVLRVTDSWKETYGDHARER